MSQGAETGKVWLVGAGPGDPGLITVRGAELLSRAEVVLHDALSHPALLDLCPSAEKHDVGKRFGEESAVQSDITSELIHWARLGKRVVRLKGGDPLLFARGAEEALALADAGIPFEIVPGIASPVAASAYAGISLTHRDLSSSVTFITGSDREGKAWSPDAWRKLATATHTICVLMGMRRLEEIVRAIVDGGRDEATPVAVVQWGARPNQRVVVGTLGTVAERVRAAGVTNPAVIIVGETVALREKMAWFDAQPLFGKRLLVPRPVEQARSTALAIRERGAEAVLEPAIAIEAAPDPDAVARAAQSVGTYDWVVFTSQNGVARFWDALDAEGLDARAFGAARVAVIGPKTGEALSSRGIRADLVAPEYVAESLVSALSSRASGEGRGLGRVLVARALVARDVVPEALRAHGAEVDVVAVYETRAVRGPARERLRNTVETADVVLFTSSSMVASLVEALGERGRDALSKLTVACIGPVTRDTAERAGLRVDVVADVFTVEGLLDALEDYFRRRA